MKTHLNFRNSTVRDVALLFLLTASLLTSTLVNAQTNTIESESDTWVEGEVRSVNERDFRFLDADTAFDLVQIVPNKLKIGFNLSQYQKDFGIGIHVISPYFMRRTVAIRAGTNIQWFEDFKTTYQNIQLGMRGRSNLATQNISIYGEGGVLAVLPNSDLSSRSLVLGGYGLFGFEFKIAPRFAYFIELGAAGTGATADKLENKPVYSNGFLSNVGIKIGF